MLDRAVVRILPCVLACLCLQRWALFGVWCRHGGVCRQGMGYRQVAPGLGSKGLVLLLLLESRRQELSCSACSVRMVANSLRVVPQH